MNTRARPPADTDPPAPATAWADTLGHIRSRALRSFAFLGALCLGIAVLMTAIDGRGFPTKLLYSLCIGASCQLLVDGGRLAAAAAADALQRWCGLSPAAARLGRGWSGVAIAMPLAALGGPVLGLNLADLLTGYESPSLLRFEAPSTRLTLALAALGTIASVFAIGTLERLANARAQAEAAQRLAAENQLRLLQSQLQPHMLFNTLANLRVLIGVDPPRAQAMLDRLIGFLRATLSASRQDSHTLAAEFRHVDDYLALMAVRMGPRLQLRLRLPPELAALPVPPLLLQPLVENAIQHGLEPKVEGGRIEVEAAREGARLRLVVRDSGVGLHAGAATAGSHFGLSQVRTRLATLFGNAATLQLADAADAEGGVLATIELPLPPTATAP